ncbi:MAG: DegT/DnrJ/EryC1/StrS family aminotransferase [Deltaproteobacteria bacterium]
MSRKLPLIGYPLRWSDWCLAWRGLVDAGVRERFGRDLAAWAGKESAFLLNSGSAAFLLILRSLCRLSSRREVLLPCYTAPSLVVAIRKAGLEPACCDISSDDLNADADDLLRRVNGRTLAVVGVHMFGIPWTAAAMLRQRLPRDVFFIEDAAQAFGATIGGRPVGAFGDASFYSFNRGKNLPVYAGGCALTSDARIGALLREAWMGLKGPGLGEYADVVVKLGGLCLAFKPGVYGLLSRWIARYKETSVPLDIPQAHLTGFQAAFGRRLLASSQRTFSARRSNAAALMQGLSDIPGVRLPRWTSEAHPVLNRLPVVIEETAYVPNVIDRLEGRGIEASRLYVRPLHRIFDIAGGEAFPNAEYLAQRLVTLPVHPLVTPGDIEVMIEVIREQLK